MAIVSHYEYHRYDIPPFQPGAAQTLWFGPWNWTLKGVTVTAAPSTRPPTIGRSK